MNFNEEMIPERLMSTLSILVSAYVVALSVYLLAQGSHRPGPYLVAILLIAVAWLIRFVTSRNRATDSTPRYTYRRLTRAIIVAGILMAIPLTRQLGIG